MLFLLTIHVLAFFIGVGFWLSCCALLVLVLYRIFFSVRMSKEMIFQGAFLALPFLLVASMPTRFIDAGRYYDQSVRWFMHGIPAGLANFDLYFIQMSAVHSFEAVGNQLAQQGQNLLTPLISLLVLLRAFIEMKNKFNNPFFIFLLILFFGGAVHFFQTSSPDILLITLVTAIFLNGDINKLSKQNVLLLGILAPFLKLTALPITLLAALWLLQLKAHRALLLLFLAMPLLLVKHIWLAGWLPVIGSVPVFWKIPANAASFISKSVAGYEEYNSKGYVFGRFRLPDLLIGILYLFTLLSYIRLFGYKHILSIFALAFFIFWIIVYPQGRYILPFWFILLAQLSRISFTFTFNRRWTFVGVFVIGLLSTLINWTSYFNDSRIVNFLSFSGYDYVAWIKPHPLWEVETEVKTLENDFQYHVPLNLYQCFDSPFPCSANVGQYQEGDKRYMPVYSTEPFPHFRYRE